MGSLFYSGGSVFLSSNVIIIPWRIHVLHSKFDKLLLTQEFKLKMCKKISLCKWCFDVNMTSDDIIELNMHHTAI